MSTIQMVRLQEWRERRHLTQSELARRAGVKTATIARIEQGIHRPRLATAFRLAHALDVRPEQLLEWLAESESVEFRDPSVDELPAVSTVIEGALPENLLLQESIAIKVWREGSEYVADAPHLGVHAFGQSEDDAVANLRSQIVEQFRRLEELGDRLAPRMMTQRDRLRHALAAVYA